jgi:proteic killer suppression protein
VGFVLFSNRFGQCDGQGRTAVDEFGIVDHGFIDVTEGVTLVMILSFAHKGLQRFFSTGSTSGIQARHARRLRLVLSNLDQAAGPDDMDLPGLKLHRLKGARSDIWAVSVSGNWRVTFRFVGRDSEVVNYEDYH